MLTDVRPKEAVVAAAVGRLSNLAMLPETAVRVLQLAENPNVTMARLADVISASPELSARILRIVNSAFYAFPTEIRSIERATTLLGLQSVRNVTIAASLTRLLNGRALSSRFAPKDLWTHSISVAAATRLLALASTSAGTEEAFLAGLLHDVGLMLELQLHRVKLAAVLAIAERDEPFDVLATEEATFGANHQDFGAAMLHAWRLPRVFVLAAGHHHRPHEAPATDRLLPLMVHVADRLVAASSGPFVLDDPSIEVGDDLLDVLRLTREQLSVVVAALPAAIGEIESVFGPA